MNIERRCVDAVLQSVVELRGLESVLRDLHEDLGLAGLDVDADARLTLVVNSLHRLWERLDGEAAVVLFGRVYEQRRGG